MFRKFTSTSLTLTLLAALISVSAACGPRSLPAFAIKSWSSEPASLNISYHNQACGQCKNIKLDENDIYNYVNTQDQCGDITVAAKVDGQECAKVGDPFPVPQRNFTIVQGSTGCTIRNSS